MARMIPPQIGIRCESAGEKDIFRTIAKDEGSKDWIVLHSLDIVTHQTRITGEIDFVFLIPGHGVICAEVKGCSKLEYKEGVWLYGTDFSPDKRGPFRQALEGMHSLRQYVLQKDKQFANVMFWHCVIFPYINFNLKSPEWHDWQIIDNERLKKKPLSESLKEITINAKKEFKTKGYAFSQTSFSAERAKALLTLIRPNFEFFENPSQIKEKSTAEIRSYTEEQFSILDAMALNERVIFSGPAGTGKTVLAIEAARRAYLRGAKVLLVCFNKHLGKWLRSQFEGTGINIDVGTLHSHMLAVAGCLEVKESEANSDFWRRQLPREAKKNIAEKHVYDEIVIDEFQDLGAADYLEFLDASLKNGLKNGRWIFFGDFERQVIYEKNVSLQNLRTEKLHHAPLYGLRVNCRNTPRIASMSKFLGGLDPDYSRVLRSDDGVEPQLIYYESADDQLLKLGSLLNKYLRDGYQPHDILILSAKSDHDCCANSLINSNQCDHPLKPFGITVNGFIRYCTIHAYKGLEASVVILTDMEQFATEQTASLCYVGMSRALNRLALLVQKNEKNSVIKRLTGGL